MLNLITTAVAIVIVITIAIAIAIFIAIAIAIKEHDMAVLRNCRRKCKHEGAVIIVKR